MEVEQDNQADKKMFRNYCVGEEVGVFAFAAVIRADDMSFRKIRNAGEKYAKLLGGAYVDHISVLGMNILFLIRENENHRKDFPKFNLHNDDIGFAVVIGTVFEDMDPLSEYPKDWAGKNGRYTFLKWDPLEQKLSVTSDFLGVRAVYYAMINKGLVISNEPAILTNMSELTDELDPVGCCDMLQKGCCYGDRTIYKAIRYLRPAAVLTFQNNEIHIDGENKLPVSIPSPSHGSINDFADGLFDRLQVSTKLLTGGHNDWQVFLSGGLDSRTCLGLLNKQNALKGAINWGQHCVGDSLIASKIARHLNVPLKYIPIKHDHLYQYHEELITLAGGLTNGHITYLIAVLRSIGANRGRYCLGYSGDPLTGHISFQTPGGKSRPSIEESAEHFHGALGRFFTPVELDDLLVIPEWKDGINVCRNDIVNTMAFANTKEHYQRWLAALLWCRQARYTVFLPRLVDSFGPTFSPFEDINVFNYCLALPPEALKEQKAYKTMFFRHFPELQKFHDPPPDSGSMKKFYNRINNVYCKIIGALPGPIRDRVDYWSKPKYSIDPMADLRIGSAEYLNALLKNHEQWDWALNYKMVNTIFKDHIADKIKAGLRIQSLVTVINALTRLAF